MQGLQFHTLLDDNFVDSFDLNPDVCVLDTCLVMSKSTIYFTLNEKQWFRI